MTVLMLVWQLRNYPLASSLPLLFVSPSLDRGKNKGIDPVVPLDTNGSVLTGANIEADAIEIWIHVFIEPGLHLFP